MSDGEGLPKGWTLTSVGELASSMKNGIYKRKEYYSDDGVACLRMYNIHEGRLVWRDLKRMILTAEERSEYGLQHGDILVNRVNSRELVGKACVIPEGVEPCVFESKNIRLRINLDLADPKYLNYRLLSHGRSHFLRNLQQTVGMASVNQDQVAAFSIPLAPRREQRRIVAKIEELFSDLDAGVAALERAKANLKRYRAAVLKAAVEGRLTKAWRAENNPPLPALPSQKIPMSGKSRKKRAGRLWGSGVVPELTPAERERLPSGWIWTKVLNWAAPLCLMLASLSGFVYWL